MKSEEQNLITYLKQLADCLRPHDKWWPETLKQTAIEAESLFDNGADVISKFDFVSRHNYSTGGMGSLNDGVVPEACAPLQKNLYKAIDDLLRVYWKELGHEWHDYYQFDLIPEGTKVKLVPGKIIFYNSVYSTEVPDKKTSEQIWIVLRCDGPDITNMPSYTIKHNNTFRSARQEALEIVGERKSFMGRISG